MCGIFGYLGRRDNAPQIVIDGLKKMEYRGYDSWGIAWKANGNLDLLKSVGKIGDFKDYDLLSNANLAIGHTRWATHGGVTEVNAHPHTNEDKRIAVVHNGIIENFQELRKELIERGHVFKSETDTEVIAHLLEENFTGNLEAAVKKTVGELEGRYAICCIDAVEKKIVAARRGSPLIIGIGDDEYFVASDIPAFLEYTRKVNYLDDDEMVVIDKGMKFINLKTFNEVEKRIVEIEWNIEAAEKGEYEYFMLKEIMEQKETLNRAMNQNQEMIAKVAEEINVAFGTFLIGCGTAGKVCMTASYLFSKIAKKHVNAIFGSEFPSYHHFLKKESLLIAVSQSGETADTLEAIEVAKKVGMKIVAIVNVESSTIARMADYVIPLKVGPEKAVASTKATTAQLAILTLLAYACDGSLNEGLQELLIAASAINDMLNPRYEEYILELAKKIKHYESMYVIGRAMNYPIALEAAIKLQEVSYIHAEGFAGGELKHGPIALISEGIPCIVFVPEDSMKQEVLSNAMEIKSRGGYIIGVSPMDNEIFDYWLKVPEVSNASPIVNIIPIQILAYHLAVLRENNPDMPRNLAKSVTVK